MATPGYSGTPLLKKLGIKETDRILLIHAPKDYYLWMQKDLSEQICGSGEIPDFAHLFAASKKEYLKGMQLLKKWHTKNTQLVIWVSWFKKSSGIATDLSEEFVRLQGIDQGLVDIKVCAVSDAWSGLKFVVPLKNR